MPTYTEKNCKHHGLTTFVLEGRGTYRCKACRSGAVARRRRKIKEMLVEHFGGKCISCGYSRCKAALEFHHRDPSTKEFGLSDGGATISYERALKEAQKCDLLCANCHVEIEVGFVEAE